MMVSGRLLTAALDAGCRRQEVDLKRRGAMRFARDNPDWTSRAEVIAHHAVILETTGIIRGQDA
jgi:hypothetical protein